MVTGRDRRPSAVKLGGMFRGMVSTFTMDRSRFESGYDDCNVLDRTVQ